MTFDLDVLSFAAKHGRIDILELAFIRDGLSGVCVTNPLVFKEGTAAHVSIAWARRKGIVFDPYADEHVVNTIAPAPKKKRKQKKNMKIVMSTVL